ncbi:hypothetical protein T11_8116 [Trichinella zimbabwensis]|uniref:Uncharacterized protein n=1 Tax=Trichinella zimbabwensis TaxID=268475 RepID=A0A0V1GA39_9BILA|nr:hypothetical protein T11_8116 [Trichinella zimbabwensis]
MEMENDAEDDKDGQPLTRLQQRKYKRSVGRKRYHCGDLARGQASGTTSWRGRGGLQNHGLSSFETVLVASCSVTRLTPARHLISHSS